MEDRTGDDVPSVILGRRTRDLRGHAVGARSLQVEEVGVPLYQI